MFQPTLVQKFSRIKVFNALAAPILLYGSEIGPLERRMRKIDVNGDEHKRNESLEELKIEPVDEKLKRFKSNWLRHVTRLCNGMPKLMLKCRPNGRRRLGRPLNRLLDEAETGLSRPTS
jgi:hypothetical protein